ncbi:MAG: DNA polymerase III subunit beta [Thermogutta sp.]
MKVVANREKFAQVVQLAGMICPSRSPRPILESLLLECEDHAGTIMATDLEVGVRLEVPDLTVEVPGKTLLPYRLTASVLREIEEAQIRLESDGQKVLLFGSRCEFQFPTADAMEYPPVPSFEGNAYHSFSARTLREMLSRTEFAVEVGSTRFNLGGVYLELAESSAIAVATDGRRLARQEGPATQVGKHLPQEHVIIPARAVQLIQRIISEGDEEIKVAVEDGKIFVMMGTSTFFARLVDARFPKWREVFPKEPERIRVDLRVGELAAAMRQAAIVVDAKHPGVWTTFTSGKLVLATRGSDFGESRVELPISYEGEDLTLRLDPRFMLEFLKVLDNDSTFTWKIWQPETPVLAETTDGYAYIVMPLISS